MDQITLSSSASLEDQPDFVTALARGLAVIRALGEDGQPATLAEIARRVGLARATVRRSLITLETLGYVENDGRIFALTPKVLSLGYSYLSSVPLARASKSRLEEVSATLNASCGTAILDGDDVVMLARVLIERVIKPDTPPGIRLPVYCTATGRMLLSYESDDTIDRYLARMRLKALTPKTETDPGKIRALIMECRTSGYAFQREQSCLGVQAITVPIENAQGRVVGALNVTTPIERGSRDEIVGRFLPLLRKKAREISCAL
ncbi:MAG TPA: IclR family transcriptional regulator C-terminal domain-containing protein [Xanthobacteraceae bacterium]|jgi:IclR family pca regulon transcriptional regulator|nr:IclR family transcriptional regulator C-terminal domain-containing protein [Xanthobacteraceae bacterium]